MSISLRGLEKAFGPERILKGFDLEVPQGETLALVGPSGAGKSLTLKHIIGLMKADAGSVTVGGVEVSDLDRDELVAMRHNIGYVFQFAALFDSMTIGANVAMGLRRLRTMEDPEVEERVGECLDLVGLEGMEGRYPSQLSGGQKKRAGLARAIATRPKYLLYDEPTTGLDPVTTMVIDRLILRMRDDLGVTGLVVTHDMTSAMRIADRIAFLHEGRVRFLGTPEDLRVAEDPVLRGFVDGDPEQYYGGGAS